MTRETTDSKLGLLKEAEQTGKKLLMEHLVNLEKVRDKVEADYLQRKKDLEEITQLIETIKPYTNGQTR